MLKRHLSSVVLLSVFAVILSCGLTYALTAEEAEATYREMGCRLAGTNEQGGKHFVCCNVCPASEILKLYEASWDEAPAPTCAVEQCTDDEVCVYGDWKFVNCGGPCGTAGTCAAGEHCAYREASPEGCADPDGGNAVQWDCAPDEGCQ